MVYPFFFFKIRRRGASGALCGQKYFGRISGRCCATGGRGGESGFEKGNESKGRAFHVPKVTTAQLGKMSRKDLETIATVIYANNAMKTGISREEGVRRAKALMDGNTSAQLRKYIKKNNR